MGSFSDLLVAVSARLIRCDAQTADAAIAAVLAQLGQSVVADRVFVMRFNVPAGTFAMAYEWDAPGIHSQLGYFVDLPMRAFSWSADRLLRNETIVINTLADFPPEAGSERAFSEQEQIQSVLYVPMTCHNEVIGALGFTAIRRQTTWNAACVALLRLVGDALAHVTERNRADGLIRALMLSSPDIRLVVDATGILMEANAVFLDRFNLTRADLGKVNVLDVMPPDLARERRRHFERMLKTGQPVEFEDSNNGRHFANRYTPINEPGSSRLRLFAVHGREITEQRKLERELLRVSQQALDQVVRDLHDTVAQQLIGIRFLSEALLQQAQAGDTPLQPQIQHVHEQVCVAVTQMRQILRHQSCLDHAAPDVISSLQHLADETASVYGVPCTVVCPEALHIPEAATRHELYLIAKEAVTNAARHAHATQIVVTLGRQEDRGILGVTDDGVGFTAPADAGGHFGLRIMQVRAAVIGGALGIESESGKGTTLTCRFPL